jgi:hypothetical protein
MKELDILPLLSYGTTDVNKSNFEAIKGLMEATSPLKYARNRIVRDEILEFGVGSNEDLIEDELDNVVPIEEQGVFHAPFFFEQ